MPPKTAAYYKKQKERDKKRRQKEEAEIQAEHDAAGSPGARKEAEARAVAANLRLAQRNPVPITGDGECLYSAILHQMRTIGDKTPVATTQELRAMVADNMRRRRDDYLPYLATENGGEGVDSMTRMDAYCREVEGNAWGTQLEVRSASEVLGKRIAVVTSNGVDFYGSTADEPQSVLPNDWCIIFLQHAFVLGGHFNATNVGKVGEGASGEVGEGDE